MRFDFMAVFLAHWDNKSENQRLVCLSGNDSAESRSVPQRTLRDAAGRRLRSSDRKKVDLGRLVNELRSGQTGALVS